MVIVIGSNFDVCSCVDSVFVVTAWVALEAWDLVDVVVIGPLVEALAVAVVLSKVEATDDLSGV